MGLAPIAGQFGVIILAIMITVFIYTTMLSYGVQLESVCRYLFKADKRVVAFIRILYLLFVLSGVLIDGTIIWPMGDIGVGCMLWINTFAVLCMTPMVLRIVKDFKKQKDLGLDPIFDPQTVGIEDEEGVWDGYAELKRKRGDYENVALGYNVEK